MEVQFLTNAPQVVTLDTLEAGDFFYCPSVGRFFQLLKVEPNGLVLCYDVNQQNTFLFTNKSTKVERVRLSNKSTLYFDHMGRS